MLRIDRRAGENIVLVVEDSITQGRLLVMQLHKIGIKADCALNGLEGVNRVREKRYRLILMDVQMPELNGYEAASVIRCYERQFNMEPMAIIAVTSDLDAKLCKASGMNDWVQKPLSPGRLRELIASWAPDLLR